MANRNRTSGKFTFLHRVANIRLDKAKHVMGCRSLEILNFVRVCVSFFFIIVPWTFVRNKLHDDDDDRPDNIHVLN